MSPPRPRLALWISLLASTLTLLVATPRPAHAALQRGASMDEDDDGGGGDDAPAPAPGGDDDGGGGGGGDDGDAKAGDDGDAKAGDDGDAKAGDDGDAKAGDDGDAKADDGDAKADDGDAKADDGDAKADDGDAAPAEGGDEAKADGGDDGDAKAGDDGDEAKADGGDADEADDDGAAAAEGGGVGDDDGAELEALAEGDASEEAIEKAIAGLESDELVGIDGEKVDPEVAAMLAEDFEGPLTEQQEDNVLSAWDSVDGVELDAEIRGELKGLPAEQFEALAEISPKELGAADEITPAFAEQLESQAEAVGGLSADALDALTKVFIETLRKKLGQVRQKVLERTIEKVRVKQEEKLGKLITLLLLLSPAGLLLLAMPLVLKKKYPNQGPTLWRASAIAAVAFTGAMIMFTGLLYVLRVVQNEAGMQTNPQIRVVEASFDAVDRNLDEIAALPGLLEVPLQQLMAGQVDALEVAILQNVQSFKEDVTVFKNVAEMFKSVNWLFGWVAIAMTILTIVLFLLTIRPTLTEIVKLPARAAAGEVAPGQVVGMVGRRIGNELIATLAVAGIAVVIALVSGVIEARLVGPAMDVFVMQFLVDMQYVFVEKSFSTAYVYVSMGSVVAFLVLNIAVVVLAGGFYVGKSQKIMRLRMHDKMPLSEHKKFFLWGSLGLLWALLLPYVVVRIVLPVSEWIVDSGTSGEFNWGRVLVAGPLMLALGFIVLFIAGQGLRGMLYAMKYKVPKPGAVGVPARA
ncbi:MAG: hypothetical protein K1X88_04515 [Nannocystaceae bacterium]|nr:hypothetical protein [Nannocystaceae bacterium]